MFESRMLSWEKKVQVFMVPGTGALQTIASIFLFTFFFENRIQVFLIHIQFHLKRSRVGQLVSLSLPALPLPKKSGRCKKR